MDIFPVRNVIIQLIIYFVKMKAIVFTDHFGNGGAERVASLIINGLAKDINNEIHVCVFEDLNNYNMAKERVVFHLLTDAQKSHFQNAWLKIINLAHVIKTIKPDVIYSFGPIMAAYVYCAKIISGYSKLRVIDSERNDPRFEPVENWKKKVRNFCYNRADILVCQTPLAVELLEKQYGVNCRKVIIPNPISANLPSWKGEESKEIITAARLTEQKNLPLLIDAFAKLNAEHPDYHLTIYGEGEQRHFLSQYIEKKQLMGCVSMPGFATDIHSIMSNAYMYVSSSDYEGISNSMLEAMGIGLPCVCTDCPVGGAAMVIKNGVSGILTKVGSVEDLYKGMKTLVDDKELHKIISKSSRYVNTEYSLEKITERWIKLM